LKKLAGAGGFEPPNAGIKILQLLPTNAVVSTISAPTSAIFLALCPKHPADGPSALETILQPGALPRAQPHERFFNRIKHFRRLATRYEKHAANFLAMLELAAIQLWLRYNESVT
jgi:hypothetical protein